MHHGDVVRCMVPCNIMHGDVVPSALVIDNDVKLAFLAIHACSPCNIVCLLHTFGNCSSTITYAIWLE